jgi:anti-sigma regulatory factor (Ser/Thr protein kinase)/PAS domain-containing protein
MGGLIPTKSAYDAVQRYRRLAWLTRSDLTRHNSVNFTRWSARLPGTQRRAAARIDRGARRASSRAASGVGSSVPLARGDRGEARGASAGAVADASGPTGDPASSPVEHPTVHGLSARDVLPQVPGLIAVVYGPEHRIAYVNDAYAAVFGPRVLGAAAHEALPELAELGLLPLMDQVLRSGKPRTVKSRRVLGGGTTVSGGRVRPGYYTFTCSPIDLAGPAARATDVEEGLPAPGANPPASDTVVAGDPPLPALDRGEPPQPTAPPSAPATVFAPVGHTTPAQGLPTAAGGPHRGVLVFAADVTDQVEAAERLRVSERRQRETAVALQRSLLPQELEQPDDLRVAATYQPGCTDAAVGGDWYDVITLGAGRTALVIGDVMGRGVRAAAVMGQLRTAVRAYARLDLPPHEVLQLLDGLVGEIDPHQIVTCVYAVHDPNEGCLLYSSAGHLPILVRDSDGRVHRVAEPTGPPLGTGSWPHTSGSVPLGPGHTAVLYTDGLVERRDRDIDEGVSALEQALAGATGAPQIVCDRLIRALGVTAGHDDDVALLVLQHPERTGYDAELFHNAALDLLGGAEAAPRARAFASGVLASWRFPNQLRDLGVLAASELVANSLQHGKPPMRLRLRRTDRRLIIEVADGDDHLPRRRHAEPADEAGRGLSIIATIASAWGCRRTPGGKVVWCEFALPTG